MPTWYLDLLMPTILGILAVAMLAMGLWVLITRRPYLISARWMLSLVLLSFLPNALLPMMSTIFNDGFRSISDNVLTWAGPAMFFILAIFMSISMRGYIAIGITESSIREALFTTIDKLALPYEEALGSVRIPSIPAEIQVAVQAWIGSGQLKARKAHSRAVLKEIASGMNQHFRQTKVRANLVTPIFYVALGLMLVVMNVALIVVN
ncbi:MAG TPA: hypothetical protein VNA87_04860 [Actinomycetota bacterium]|nr:hypothetical protein [Actinomycetota bacterium]